MRNIKRFRDLIPPWQMPADPVQAVWWFLHWLLQLLTRIFWLPVIGMVLYETVNNWRITGPWNGITSGIITLGVGLLVWAVLYVVLFTVNVVTRVSRVFSTVNQFQQTYRNYSSSNPFSSFSRSTEEPNVVEGSVSDVEEPPQQQQRERRK